MLIHWVCVSNQLAGNAEAAGPHFRGPSSVVLMTILMCRLRTSGLNDTRDLETSMDFFQVSRDLQDPGSSGAADLSRGQGGGNGRGRRGRRWDE